MTFVRATEVVLFVKLGGNEVLARREVTSMKVRVGSINLQKDKEGK